jgi:hypothetical protein
MSRKKDIRPPESWRNAALCDDIMTLMRHCYVPGRKRSASTSTAKAADG